ncbi:MAG: hypothetical protein ACMG6E_01925 [Candidatus Roizmanbacteria bacterium]
MSKKQEITDKNDKKIPTWMIVVGAGLTAAVATTAVAYIATQPDPAGYFNSVMRYGKRLYRRLWATKEARPTPLQTGIQKNAFEDDDDDQSSVD